MPVIIDAYLTPYFPEHETLFDNSITVMIDVLRASTTVAVALQNGAKEVITADSLEKAVKIYSSLSKEIRFLGGERNSMKPSGFDAGNSPFEYSPENVEGKSVVLTTSNGTRIFQKAKQAQHRIIGSFVNHKVVTNFINSQTELNSGVGKIIFLCAGNDGRLSYEDVLCAGAYINSLKTIYQLCQMSDTAMAAMSLFKLHANDLKTFLKSREHAVKLSGLGFEHDLDFCFSLDVCPVVPLAGSSGIKKYEPPKI